MIETHVRMLWKPVENQILLPILYLNLDFKSHHLANTCIRLILFYIYFYFLSLVKGVHVIHNFIISGDISFQNKYSHVIAHLYYKKM